jgi:hypothetical protein
LQLSVSPTRAGVAFLIFASLALRLTASVLIGAAVMPSSRLTRQAVRMACRLVPRVAKGFGLTGIHAQFEARDASITAGAELLRTKCNAFGVTIRTALGHSVEATVCLPHGQSMDMLHLAGCVVHFGGNGQIAQLMPPSSVARYTKLGFALVLPNYRGVAGSTGLTTRRAAVVDAICVAVCSSRALGVPLTQVILEGHSIGGGFAAEAALALPHGHACLDRTFASLPDAAVLHVVPWACTGQHVTSWPGWLARRAVAAALRHVGDWGLSPLHATQQLAQAGLIQGCGGHRLIWIETVSSDR